MKAPSIRVAKEKVTIFFAIYIFHALDILAYFLFYTIKHKTIILLYTISSGVKSPCVKDEYEHV